MLSDSFSNNHSAYRSHNSIDQHKIIIFRLYWHGHTFTSFSCCCVHALYLSSFYSPPLFWVFILLQMWKKDKKKRTMKWTENKKLHAKKRNWIKMKRETFFLISFNLNIFSRCIILHFDKKKKEEKIRCKYKVCYLYDASKETISSASWIKRKNWNRLKINLKQ